MKKSLDELSKNQRKEIAALERLPEDSIDTAEIPEIIDWPTAKRGVFYEPQKRRRKGDLGELQ